MGTRIHLASTHHPQTNGLTERMNRTLINMIKKMTQDSTHEWDVKLPLFEFAYNTIPNSTTGIAPFVANQGYLPSMPASLLAATCGLHQVTHSVKQFVDTIRKEYQQIHQFIKQEEEKHQRQIAKRLEGKRGQPKYYIGDQVLMYWPPFEVYNTKPRKHRFRYEGPFTVIDIKNEHCVTLDSLPPRMPTTINVEYIHLYKRTTDTVLQQLRGEDMQEETRNSHAHI